jgi:hypothetical protein
MKGRNRLKVVSVAVGLSSLANPGRVQGEFALLGVEAGLAMALRDRSKAFAPYGTADYSPLTIHRSQFNSNLRQGRAGPALY